MIEYRARAGGLAHQSHSVRVASEEMYILLDPLKHEPLVKKPSIRRASLRVELWTSEEAECA
jgi:hypothetical protein